MKTTTFILILATAASAKEFHVASTGHGSDFGTQTAPLRSIQHASDLAQAGDVITVHAGVDRERIDPPRGGTSDAARIIYQAGPGEKVVMTGAEPVKCWVRVKNDTWQVTLPHSLFPICLMKSLTESRFASTPLILANSAIQPTRRQPI